MSNPNLKNLQLTACDVSNLNLSVFKKLDELQIVYTIDCDELKSAIDGLELGKLVVSGDMASNPSCKLLLSSIKKKGTKIEIVGPII